MTYRQAAIDAATAVKQFVWNHPRTAENAKAWDALHAKLEARANAALNAYKKEVL
jgi:hypothetical protein